MSAFALAAGVAHAQLPPPIVLSFVAPTELESAEGPTSTSGPFLSSPSTWLLRYDSTYFDTLAVPAPITGVSFRLDAASAAAWPAAGFTIADFELSLATSSAAAAAKGEFLNDRDNDFENGDLFTPRPLGEQIDDAHLVHDGPLTFNAADFPAPASPTGPAPLGVFIEFDTPYAYIPGEDLILQVRSTGLGTQPAPLLDAAPYANGEVDAIVANTFDATPDTVGDFVFETPVAAFRFEIPPVTGDLNADGNITIEDLQVIEENFGFDKTPEQGDLNLDTVIDVADATILIYDVAGTVFGDADLSGTVDTSDLAIMAANFGLDAVGYARADFTFDGVVDTRDLAVLAAGFGFGLSDTSPIAAAAVPEPGGVVAVVTGLSAATLRRRRVNI